MQLFSGFVLLRYGTLCLIKLCLLRLLLVSNTDCSVLTYHIRPMFYIDAFIISFYGPVEKQVFLPLSPIVMCFVTINLNHSFCLVLEPNAESYNIVTRGSMLRKHIKEAVNQRR